MDTANMLYESLLSHYVPQFARRLSEPNERLFNAAGLMCRPTRIGGLLTARGKIFIGHNIKFE